MQAMHERNLSAIIMDKLERCWMLTSLVVCDRSDVKES
jgi:hypothetical protein